MKTLIVSTYDSGFQSLGATIAAAHLEEAGIDVIVRDLSMTPFPGPEELQDVDLVGFYVPMYHSLPRAFKFAKYVRAEPLRKKTFFFGLYSDLSRSHILSNYGDYALSMNWEDEIVDLVKASNGKKDVPASFVSKEMPQFKEQKKFLPPARHFIPHLSEYTKLIDRGASLLVGNAETSRGCLHRCTHCPYPRVYNGKSVVIPEKVVLEDIHNLVRMGARHISFIDPDFLDNPEHSLSIISQMHEDFPFLTFNFTAQIANFKRYEEYARKIAVQGLRFVVAAFEFNNNKVLTALRKRHTVDELEWSIGFLRELGVYIKPTFVLVNPWMGATDIMGLLNFIEKHNLIDNVEPVQYRIRLLLFRNSSLLDDTSLQPLFTRRNEFFTEWQHTDPDIEVMYKELCTLIDQSVESNASPAEVFYAVKKQVAKHLPTKEEVHIPDDVKFISADDCPRFDAPNFCCTEPTEDEPMQELKDLV